MAVELAKAYVQIVPSLRGAGRQISSELGGAKFAPHLKSAGKSWGTKITAGLTSTMKKGLIGAGAGIGAAFSTSIFKGFGRLKSIEEARAGLEGMKLSAEDVAEVMANAQKSVKGTAFGLGDAATAAKGLVAAGVKPGQELERVLGLIGDTAAQSGSDLNEMGTIWNKVAARGALQGDEAAQLLERGIPIWQALGDTLHVTADEAMAMASKGQISFADFANAMENSFGGSALRMGDTVKGSFLNLGAAASRFGEMLLEDVYPKIPKFFQGVSASIDETTQRWKPFVKTGVHALEGIGSVLRGQNWSAQLEAALGPRLADMATRTAINIRTQWEEVSGKFAAIGKKIQGSLAKAFTGSRLFGAIDKIVNAAAGLGSAFADVLAAIVPVVGQAGGLAAVLGGTLLDVIATLAPSLGRLAAAVVDAAAPFTGVFVSGIAGVLALAEPLARVVGSLADMMARLPAPILAAGAAFVAYQTNLGGIRSVVGDVVGRVRAMWTQLKDTQGVLNAIAPVGQQIGVVGTAAHTARGAISKFGGVLKGAFKASLPTLAISGLVAVIGAFTSSASEAKQKAGEVADTFDTMSGKATQATREWVASELIANGAADAYTQAGGKLADLVDYILDSGGAAKDAVNQVRDAGDLIGGSFSRSLGDVSTAYREGKEQAELLADANRDAAGAITELKRAQDELYNAEKARTDKVFAARQAERDWTAEMERTNQVMADGASTINDQSAQLDRLAQAGLKNVDAARDNGAAHSDLVARMASARAEVIKTAQDMGWSTEQAESYADSIGLIPDSALTEVRLDTAPAFMKLGEVETQISLSSGEIMIDGNPVSAQATLREILGDVDEATGTVDIAGNKVDADTTLAEFLMATNLATGTVKIQGNDYEAQEVVNAYLAYVSGQTPTVQIQGNDFSAQQVLTGFAASVYGKNPTAYIKGDTSDAQSKIDSLRGQIVRIKVLGMLQGLDQSGAGSIGFLRKANGGLTFFARGGIKEKRLAQIAPAGAWRVWAEPETGGEAYIPLAKSKRARSTAILGEVARRFGYGLTSVEGRAYATGGLNKGISPATAIPEAGGIQYSQPVTIVSHDPQATARYIGIETRRALGVL